ncbi:MAG: head-tail connector protein [Polynucleobacter sp.]
MGLVESVAPTIEPVTLAEAKQHLKLDTGSFADSVASTVSIAPDAWPITPAYGVAGTGVSVLNKSALVQISVGTVGAGATLDYKIQESDLGVTYTDWPGQSYTQITAAGTYEKAYTGTKVYIKVVATVAVDAIDFGASVITQNYQVADDTEITTMIKTARRLAENIQGRATINRTYELTLDAWPCGCIDLPMPPAVSVTSIIYTTSAGTATTWSATEYQLDATGFVGRISPTYGYSWPSETLRTLAGIKVTYVAGTGATAATVPNEVKHAIMLLVGELYENREDSDTMEHNKIPWGIMALLGQDKVYKI